jgi:hypothetical protein
VPKSFLTFVDKSHLVPTPSRKTKVWSVNTVNGTIGDIIYFNRWRKYVFEPGLYTFFDESCLQEIITFLSNQNAARKIELAARKAP